jgi:hypothetical protein
LQDDRIAKSCYRFGITPHNQKVFMLITFTSKAAAEVTMYKEHAKRILDLLGKDVNRGVITAAEAPQAVDVLEKEIAETRMHQASDDVQRDVHAHHGDVGEDTEHEGMEVVSFATRAYPLLEMLRAARNGGFDVLWGV